MKRVRESRLRRVAGERGQALVEFAVLLPALLLLVFGVMDFGRALFYWIDLTHLANEGSRYAAVNYWPGCAGDSGSCTPATLKEYLVQRANTSELKDELNDPAEGVRVCYPGTMEPGQPVRVVVEADVSMPMLGPVLNLLGDNGKLGLSAQSTMRLERDPTRLDSAAEGVTPCP